MSATRRRIAGLIAVLVAAAVLAVAWRWSPLRALADPATLASFAVAFKDSPLAPLGVVAAFVAASLLAMPMTLLILATALVFDPLRGFVYAFTGAMFAGAATYWLGRALGRDAVRRVAGPRIDRLSRLLARRGVLAVATVRLLPVAPFTLVNLVAGASHLRARDFLLGNALGLLPGCLVMVLFAERLAAAVLEPSTANLMWFALALAAVAGGALALNSIRKSIT